MEHKLRKLWAQINWISRDSRGIAEINWTNDPELKRIAKKAGKKLP